MRISIQKIFEIYENALRELGYLDEVYQSGDLENIFDEAFKEAVGYFPDSDTKEEETCQELEEC